MDNATRWNSVSLMLTRALNVKERIVNFVRLHKGDPTKYHPQQDKLTNNDWKFLECLHDLLENFYVATMTTQGSEQLLDHWFTTIHWLMNEVDRCRQLGDDYRFDDSLITGLASSWLKLEKYYKLADEMPLYYASIVLNPTLKMRYFKQIWQTEETEPWVSLVEEKVKAIWRTQYKKSHLKRSYSTMVRPADSAFQRLSHAKRIQCNTAASEVDQLDAYLSIDRVQYDKDAYNGVEYDVLGYWMERRDAQPELAQFAFDVFAIPVMSDDNGRSFSSGRDMVTYRRTRSKGDIIEACQCLKSWLPLPKGRRHENGNIESVFDEEDGIQDAPATATPENGPGIENLPN